MEGLFHHLAGRVAKRCPAKDIKDGADQTGRVSREEEDGVRAAAGAGAAVEVEDESIDC
jgi:hypothetical protein